MYIAGFNVIRWLALEFGLGYVLDAWAGLEDVVILLAVARNVK